MSRQLQILSQKDLEGMRKAGKLAAELLNHLGEMVKPGISTQILDDEAVRWTTERGAISAPLGYPQGGANPFPRSICTSINEVICHGIPSKKEILKDGDIINIDVTPIVDGYHGDTSRTFLVGNVDPKARQLVEVTQECLKRGIAEVGPGVRTGNIGAAIQEYAEGFGFGVVREFVGHGVGRVFHSEPTIHHYGTRNKGPRLKKGTCFTIEPMINLGGWQSKMLDDGWTAITKDGSLSAQFEHTLVVTDDGCEILTKI